MAQGDSITGICNAALIALGEDPVTAVFPPDPVKRAILCSQRYDAVRRELLRKHPFHCARAQVQLAASATKPLFKWANAFPLPADFIRLWGVDPDNVDQNLTTWEVVDGQILTNEQAPLDLDYVRNLTDPTRFDPLFARCLALALADDIAEALTASDRIAAKVQNALAAVLPDAKTIDSQDDGPQELDDDVWLRSRR